MAAKPGDIEAENHAKKLARLKDSLFKLFPHRPRLECLYCCETKLSRAFAAQKMLPYSCRDHLKGVCKACIRASLGTQLDSRPLLEVGCPQCTEPWSSEFLRVLLGNRDRKRFQRLDLLARGRGFVPETINMPERKTLDMLLEQGARLCPWCRYPFIKSGGCDFMSCTKCGKGFTISYALVLEDGNGRRAANVSDDDDWEFDI